MKLCKICDVTDWDDEGFQAALKELNLPVALERVHRKYWEFAMGIQALRKFNKLHENALALGVGSGKEPFMYYLANHIKCVYATDIYGVGAFVEREAQEEILVNPAKFAPFPYREGHLKVEFMDARELRYDSNMFDLVFSFSSIEHFGSRADIKQAMAEIGRVLKPGGLAVIATEIILNRQPHPEFFRPDELISCLAEPGGLEVVEEEIELKISKNFIDKPLQWDEREDIFPHITLQIGDVIFTSVFLVLRKSENQIKNKQPRIDPDLRFTLDFIKADFAKQPPPIPQLQMRINESKIDNIPLLGNIFRMFRRQFHQLIIFYLLPLFEYIQHLAEYQAAYTSQNPHTLHLLERLVMKSDLAASRSETQSLQARIEALEQKIEEFQNVKAVTYE